MKSLILTVLLAFPALNNASQFIPQAFVDLVKLSPYIVGPLDIKQQANSFIKGFFNGSGLTLANNFADQKVKLLLSNGVSTIFLLDLIKNSNSLCIIARTLGHAAGYIGAVKLIKKFNS